MMRLTTTQIEWLRAAAHTDSEPRRVSALGMTTYYAAGNCKLREKSGIKLIKLGLIERVPNYSGAYWRTPYQLTEAGKCFVEGRKT